MKMTIILTPSRRTPVWGAFLIFTLMAWLAPTASLADPPPWAPAHGWRAKHDPNYTGYTGTKWPDDYGVTLGHCNRQAVGAVVGGVIGATVGSRVGGDENKRVATILGGIIGAAIGAKIGHDLDQADRGCLAQALELAPDKKRVTWATEDGRVQYRLTPIRGFTEAGRPCREYSLSATSNGRTQTTQGQACQSSAGVWQALAK